ncbi:MAG: ABC transporter permease [Gemmatimonadota bacterium]
MTERALRLLLALAPASFREERGEELLRVHRERAGSRRGRAAVWFAVREVIGMVGLVVRLRVGRGVRPGGADTGMGGGGSTVDRTLQDLGYAVRTLTRNPGYSLTAIGVLALGIGANAAIFSAANAYLFRPLPFDEPDRLVTIYETNPEYGWTEEDHTTAAPANVLDWREQVGAFEDVAMYSEFVGKATWIRDGEPILVNVSTVTGNFFDVAGVGPAVGRGFRFEETWDGRDDVVVLSHGFWTRQFGADPGVVGRTVEFGTNSVEVVGVMPAGFTFPGRDVDLWTPFGWDPAFREAVWFRRAHWVRPVARLAPGLSPEEADAQLQVVVARLQRDYPETNAVMGAGMMPFRAFLVRDVRTPLAALAGAVTLLLLLACVNVANLALVRSGERSREVAVRFALGAGRGRIVALVGAESLVLAGVGGAVGLALGWLGVRAVGGLTLLGIEGVTAVALDHRVVLFTLAVTGASGILFGLAPALRAAGEDVGAELKEGGRGGSEGRRRARASRALVAAEVALALLIAVGAGLMVRTAWELRHVDPGFTTEGVLAVRFDVPTVRYAARDDVLAFYDRFLEGVEGRPGVERAGLIQELPLAGLSWSSQFQAEGWPEDRVGFEIIHRRADRGYFEALDIPLVLGRLFGPADGPDTPPVVVINETFAREHFPGEDPIGRRIAFDRAPDSTSTWLEIVGIVGDQNQESPGVAPRAEVFENAAQDWSRSPWVVLRTRAADAMSALPAARSVLAELDPLIPIAEVRPLREVWRSSMARQDLVLALLGAFGVLALLLATVGVYGVTAQVARRRTREIGIRMALGAAGSDVLQLMLRQGMAAVLVGLAVGSALALAATGVLESLLFGVEPTDPATLGGVALFLLLVAAAASWIPARRATRVDPVETLRSE